MAIAHDATTLNAANYTSTGTQTTTHTAGASARAAVVLISQNGSSGDQVTGVTYNGVAMTRLRFDVETTEPGAVYIYWLDGITGNGSPVNVNMTTNSLNSKRLAVSTMTVAANKAVAVGGSNTTISASGANPTTTITGLTSGTTYYSYFVLHSGLQTMTTTPGTGWTSVYNEDLGSQGRAIARRTAVDSAITSLACTWTAATADDYVISGVAFYETAINVNGNASLATTVGLTSTGNKAAFGNATPTSTVGITATGAANYSGGASAVAESVTVTAAGVNNVTGDASLSLSFAADPIQVYDLADKDITLRTVFPLGINPAVNVTGDASLAESVTIASTGAMGYVGNATVSPAVAITATATVGRIGNATLSESVSITSTGNKAAFGGSSLTASVSITSTATVGKFGDATLTESVTLASTGNRGAIGNATLSETVSVTAGGAATGLNNASLTETVSITASGLAQYQQGASLTASVGITSTATVGRIGDATRSVTVGLSSTGNMGAVAGATLAESVSITADGSKSVNGSATDLAVAVSLAATASVEIPTPLDSYLQANVLSSASGFITRRVALFSPPTRDIAYGRKIAPKAWWVKKEEGITLLKEGGVWRQTVNPSNDEIVAAERCYLGGRNYQLDATQESELIAAGYGALITEEYVDV